MNKHPLTAAIDFHLARMRARNAVGRYVARIKEAAFVAALNATEAERRANVWWRRLLRWLRVRR